MMVPEVGLLRRWMRFVTRLTRLYLEDRCAITAAELSFVTVLAFVPALAVIFPILAVFPGIQQVGQELIDFALRSFFPESSHLLTQQAAEIASKAAELSPLGVFFLVVTVLLTMARVEEELNRIWGVEHRRGLTSRLPIYWTILTVGPMLLGAGLLTSSYVASLPFLRESIGYQGLAAWWMRLLPVVSSGIVFFLLYWLVPNRRIRWTAAATAAVVAALAFQAALAGFTLYFRIVPTYRALYGAVASIPVFLVWIYISWNVILAGAELSYCLTVPPQESSYRNAPGIDVRHALTLLRLLHRAQGEGRPLTIEELDRNADSLPPEHRGTVLSSLEDHGLLMRTEGGDFVATRALGSLSLAEVWESIGSSADDPR